MKTSSGILLFRMKDSVAEFFLVHPGGPFWKNKDEGAWSIPKGEFTSEENALEAAKREFLEETGNSMEGNFIELSPVKQKGGKIVYCWAVEGDMDANHIHSNSFSMEWPFKSGKFQSFPEVDKAAWFTADEARKKINPAQVPFIEEVLAKNR
jgi:predicted NUDIX family NTP pyrophosphohydrolase